MNHRISYALAASGVALSLVFSSCATKALHGSFIDAHTPDRGVSGMLIYLTPKGEGVKFDSCLTDTVGDFVFTESQTGRISKNVAYNIGAYKDGVFPSSNLRFNFLGKERDDLLGKDIRSGLDGKLLFLKEKIGGSIEGQVLDPDGKPVETGGTVAYYIGSVSGDKYPLGTSLMNPLEEKFRVTIDGESLPLEGESYGLLITCPSYIPIATNPIHLMPGEVVPLDPQGLKLTRFSVEGGVSVDRGEIIKITVVSKRPNLEREETSSPDSLDKPFTPGPK